MLKACCVIAVWEGFSGGEPEGWLGSVLYISSYLRALKPRITRCLNSGDLVYLRYFVAYQLSSRARIAAV